MALILNSKFKHIAQFVPVNTPLYKQYEYLFEHQGIYWYHFRDVFGPFPQPIAVWDISEEEKLFLTNRDLENVLIWINKNIIVRLSKIDETTLGVLIRIATGMLNKVDIPKELSITLHNNMVENLKEEHKNMLLSQLPF